MASIIQIFVVANYFDTKKAERYFKERRIPYQYVDLSKKGMSKGELRSVRSAIGSFEALVDFEKNGDAAIIRYLAAEEEKLEKLEENPKWLKTPLVRCGRKATVGYCPEIWKGWETE